jgi:hypothetical protein
MAASTFNGETEVKEIVSALAEDVTGKTCKSTRLQNFSEPSFI